MSPSRGCFAALLLAGRVAQGSSDGGTCSSHVTPRSLSQTPWRLELKCDDPGRVLLSLGTQGASIVAGELAVLPHEGAIAVQVNRAAVRADGGLELGWSETHTWPASSSCSNSVKLEARLICSPQCELTVSRARSQSTCAAAPCLRAPLSVGQSWVETIATTEQYRSEPPRPDSDGLDQSARLRTLKVVLAIGDGGMSVASVPLELSAPLGARRATRFYPSFGEWAPSLLWPNEFSGHGGQVFAEIVKGDRRPARLTSRKAVRHRLGPAHVFEVSDADHDSSASCGGLATTTGERVEGTITVLDDTSLIVAANLIDDEFEENDRHFQQDLEDGGIEIITGHSVWRIHRSETIDVSCNADSSK